MFAEGGDFQKNVSIRGKKYADQLGEDTKDDDDENHHPLDDDETREAAESLAMKAQIIFKKQESETAVLSDFEIMKMVGKGTFGKVYLVINSKKGTMYAMKVIRKDIIIDNEQFENIQLEKDILFKIEHPFIVGMEFVFQNQFRIYFLMNFIRGGELFRHLVKVKRFTEPQAKFFVIQIAMALGHLHSKSIVYRDLKPENILVGEDGYLKLADFGLAKIITKNQLANSFCGTAEYLAPEMLTGTGHDFTVDWWALGILLYEMLVGIPPFFHRNKHRMYFLIKESPVNFPDPIKHGIDVSPNAKDLIRKLLEKNKKKRLGGLNDITEILSHPFFADIDQDKLLRKELTPPYMAAVDKTQEYDLTYFDQKLTSRDEFAESVIDDANLKLIDKNKHIFKNF